MTEADERDPSRAERPPAPPRRQVAPADVAPELLTVNPEADAT